MGRFYDSRCVFTELALAGTALFNCFTVDSRVLIRQISICFAGCMDIFTLLVRRAFAGINGGILVLCGNRATSQMFTTSALIAAVSGSQFAVGTAMSKTESVQATFFGLLILSETISLLNFAGILISLLGAFLVTGVFGNSSTRKRPSSRSTRSHKVLYSPSAQFVLGALLWSWKVIHQGFCHLLVGLSLR